MNKQINHRYIISYIGIKILCILTCIALINCSCNKQLNAGPIDVTYSGNFWTSQNAVENATVGMYAQLRYDLRERERYFMFGDVTGGLFVSSSYPYNQISSTTNPPYQFSVAAGQYLGAYVDPSDFYKVIAQANLILQRVSAMDSSLFEAGAQNAYIGEALFMRAYTYFYITRVWGDPVYVTKSYDTANFTNNIPPLARTAQKIVLDSELNELRYAGNYLSYSGGNPAKTTRVNKGSVYALMAEIFEWQHQYDSAHKYCQLVINNGGYSLEPMETYTNIWKGKSSNESIFELSMTYNGSDPNFNGSNNNGWNDATFDFFGTFLKGSIVNNINTSCWISPQGGIVDNILFDTTNDLRFKTIMQQVSASGGDAAGYMLLKYTNFMYQSPNNSNTVYLNNDLVLIRLADIILLDAEALAYKGDFSGAQTALAITENRAGIRSFQNVNTTLYDIIMEIEKERGRELIGEGLWYYDLIRTQATINGLDYIAGYPSDRVTPEMQGYYWPLDLTTLFYYDPLLTQIPYWLSSNVKYY